MIKIKVNHAEIRFVRKEIITSGSANTFHLQCEFNESWDNLTKTVLFKAGSTTKGVKLDENNTAVIPWQVLQQSGLNLYISLVGTLREDTIFTTVWTNIGIIQAGLDTHSNDEEPSPTLPDFLLKKIIRQIGNLEDLKTEEKQNLVDAINEVYEIALANGGSGGTSEGTFDHSKLLNRNEPDQHTISAITGLVEELQTKLSTLNIGDNMEIVNNKLQVKVASTMEQDNTLPITSSAVYTTVGNIQALLDTI